MWVAKFFAYRAAETYLQSRAGGTSDLLIQANGASNLKLFTNSSERLRIESDGDFLLSSDNVASNFAFIRGWQSSTGDMIIGADQSASGTGDSKSNLIFRSRGSEVGRFDNEANLTVVGSVESNNLSGRNMIINGDMRVAQRGTSAAYSSSASAILACDRWIFSSNGTTGTVAQVAEVPDASGFKYSLKATNTNTVGS